MSPDDCGAIALLLYLAAAVGIVVRQSQQAGGMSNWLLSRLMRLHSVLMLSQRVHGICPLPGDSGALVIANHRSPVDPVIIYSASLQKRHGFQIKVIGFLTAEEYCSDTGLLGWIIRTARCIPVDREKAEMGPVKEALRRLRSGEYVGVFPEGRLNTGEGLLPFNSGAAWLALRGEVPVFPVFVRNTPQGDSMVRAFFTRQTADVLFGPPLDFTPWQHLRPTPEVLEAVTDYIRESLASLAWQLPPLPQQH